MNDFQLPYHLLVDEGIFNRVNEMMKDCVPDIDQKKALLVTDQTLQKIYADTIGEICKDFHCQTYLVGDGSFDQSVQLAKYLAVNDIKVVIGFGGGTVLDMTKYAAFVSKVLYIALPTTLSNDSLASPVSVLSYEGKKRKTFSCAIPGAIIIDVNVITSAPELQLLAGIGDTISKYTALKDWKIDAEKTSKPTDDFAYMISKMAFNAICYNEEKDLKSKAFIKILAQALVMGGLAMEIAGNSRPASGSEHLFCHSLEENYADKTRITHGIAVAMGSVPATMFHGGNVEKIKRLIHQYNIPIKPSRWDITEDIFVGAWQTAAASRPDRRSILDTADLSKKNLKKIYQMMEAEF